MSGGTCTTHPSEHIMDLTVISNLIAHDLIQISTRTTLVKNFDLKVSSPEWGAHILFGTISWTGKCSLEI